jgi:hypothetical protein
MMGKPKNLTELGQCILPHYILRMGIWKFLELEYGKSAQHTSKTVFLDNKPHEEDL